MHTLTILGADRSERNNVGISALETHQKKERVLEKRVFVYTLALPLMWYMAACTYVKKWVYTLLGAGKPRVNSLFFDALSAPLKMIRDGATSWKALDIIYNNSEYCQNLRGIESVLSRFWLGMRNAQAVRNRKKVVSDFLAYQLKELYSELERPIRIFSIASGSAQAVLEAIAETKVPTELYLLDLDPAALEHSAELIKRMSLENSVSLTTLCSRVNACGKNISYFNPDIVEMVGFLDYRPDEKAVRLMSGIYDSLMPNSCFITANVCDNPEKFFLSQVINWSMIYRKPDQLEVMMREAGFKTTEIVMEPQQIHAIGIGIKT